MGLIITGGKYRGCHSVYNIYIYDTTVKPKVCVCVCFTTKNSSNNQKFNLLNIKFRNY